MSCERVRAERDYLRSLWPTNGLGEDTNVRQLIANHRAWTQQAQAESARRGAAIERVRALCADYMAEAEGGGYTNVDSLWPTDVLAILDEEEP